MYVGVWLQEGYIGITLVLSFRAHILVYKQQFIVISKLCKIRVIFNVKMSVLCPR